MSSGKTTTLSASRRIASDKKATARKATARKATTVKASVTSTAEKIEHTFENGLKVSGTMDQLTSIAKAMGLKLVGVKAPGLRGFYPSESKGLVKISDMNDYHIRRALLKRAKDYFADVFDKEDSNEKFLKKFISLSEDEIIVDLYTELAKRKKVISSKVVEASAPKVP